jgi:hypothetical protein
MGDGFTGQPRGGKMVTAATSRADEVNEGEEACLPEGGLDAGIQGFASFCGLLEWVWDVFQSLRTKMRSQLSTAKKNSGLQVSKDDLFPLPTSQTLPKSFVGTVGALNDLAGHPPTSGDFHSPDSSRVVQKTLRRLVERFEIWDSPCPQVSFKQLFSSKTIDYSGEEVKVAQRLNWTRVSSST